MGLRSASAKRRFTQSVIALVAVVSATAASAVQMTIGSASIGAPGPISVPVTVADTAGILGIAISFTYNSSIATATAVSGVTGVTNNCTIVPSINTPGMVVITAACPQGLPAGTNKDLFKIDFNATAVGTTALTFAQTPEVPNGCLLNEGSPSCDPLVNGQLTIGQVVATATATNTTVPATATATAISTSTRTATSTATQAVATATASATGTVTFTNTIGPSPTPSETRTTTATLTPANTATVTSTPVATNTFTATFTVTSTPTQTETRTVTPTRTITNTPNATQTRPPIPVVPSPASPAGVLMIVALGGGLVWALRRVSKSR